ncbi:glycoside hydrolase [Leptospira perolatii]|uniref:Glycoside hydrolase n=1 Tax=Leptospira perolatii TaxID=2023191 RepID=A0A2M9ZLS0_9LEPT|nr:glycosyltransferase family 1 protein [Leptospira perolatii]PJZ69826.1 glycoside hydrolase [Leptospira perolatii]PJZ72959.1 glycoside hydrolase [Leptospira perolatii]
MRPELYCQNFINPSPKRILVVTETFPPEINGVSKSLYRMVSDQLERGNEIILVRPRQNSADMALASGNYREVLVRGANIPFYEGLKFGFPEKRLLRRLISLEKPDLVHVVTEGPLGWSAVRAANHLKIPVISDFRTNFHSYTKYYKLGLAGRFVQTYLRGLHNKTHATLAPTGQIVSQLTELGYKNVMLVSRGIDTDLFHPAKRNHDLRKEWGIGEQDLAVVYVGRLAPEKNLDLLIRSFRKIKLQNDRAKLILIGDGPLKTRLSEANPDFIFAGMKSGNELAKHYASGDLFLFPSVTETFGNVVMEAMASGLPIVAYDYAAAKQHLENGKSAFLPNFENEEKFIEYSVLLAANRTLSKKFRSSARKAAEICTWDCVAESLEDIYEQFSAKQKRKVKSKKANPAKLKVAFQKA